MPGKESSFFNIFGKGRGSSYLGIDIGTTAIKAVEIVVGKEKPTLVNYGVIESKGYLDRYNSAIQTSSLKATDNVAAEIIRSLVREMGVKTKIAGACLPSFAAFTFIIELPAMSDKEMADAIPYQAKALVPLPMSEVSVDWIPIGQFEDEKGDRKQRVFLVSVANDYIRLYQSIFKKAGLDLHIIELEGMSLARSLTSDFNDSSIIVDIGSFSTAVIGAERGVLKYSSQIDFAGNSLTMALVKGLGINAKRAEMLKCQQGLTGMRGEYGLSTLMLPFLDVIINEVRKVKSILETRGGGAVSKIILSGGGSELPALREYVSSQLGISALRADPFKNISYAPHIAPLVQGIAPRLGAAVGVALKITT